MNTGPISLLKMTPVRRMSLAYLLTPFVREMITSPIPMGIFDAPTAGTGKSLLVQCISLVASGKLPPMSPQPESDAEWRKALTAHLVKLPLFLIFDNLSRVLNSASLAEMLTSPFWSDRLLGSTRTVSVYHPLCNTGYRE